MVTIIGAGPAGSYTAKLLAQQGFKVQVYEEHSRIGSPVQCTGIVTNAITDLIKIPDELIKNRITEVEVFSPDKSSVHFNLKKPNLILDREKFDQCLAGEAKEEGAKIFLKHKFLGVKNGKALVGQKKARFDYLVGADGPNSLVAKTFGMFGNRSFVVGHQARIKANNNPDLVEFWLGIGSFAWIVPESEKIVRCGIVARTSPQKHFAQFLKTKKFSAKQIREYQSGIIPVYNPKLETQKQNVFLVGDAATQVKATSYGGIIQGLTAAEELAKAMTQKKDYEKLWKKRIGKELKVALLIREVMDKFSPKEYDELLQKLAGEKTRQILETHDRDFPTQIAIRLILSKPSLIKFVRKLLA